MPEFVVKQEFSCEADSVEDAVYKYLLWLARTRGTVKVHEIGNPNPTEVKL